MPHPPASLNAANLVKSMSSQFTETLSENVKQLTLTSGLHTYMYIDAHAQMDMYTYVKGHT